MRTIWSNIVSGIASVTLTAGIVAYADPALASVPTDSSVVAVTYDVSAARTEAGRNDIARRIRSAADAACDTGGDHLRAMECRDQAVGDAMRDLDTQLAAL